MANYKEEDSTEVKFLKGIGIGFIVLLIMVCIFGGFYIIGPGERGVLVTLGKADMDAKTSGLHFKIPLIQSVKKMNIQTQKYEADLSAASKDLQDVKTGIAINYRIVPESVPQIYTTLGMNYADTIIYPLEQETNKAVTARYTAEELITKRDSVREAMKTELAEKLRARNIIVEEVSIVNFEFSPSFTQAIEAKVTAEQNALREQNNLKVVEFQADQKVAEAEGQAQAIKIIEEQLSKSNTYIEWMKVQKWNGVLPSVTSGMPFIDVSSKVQ